MAALCLDSLLMAVDEDDASVDRARLRVPLAGAVAETGDLFEPYRLLDDGGHPVVPVTEFLRGLQAAGRSEATQRSYSMDLLRWFRFTWAAGFEWDQATRAEARDFCRWLQLSDKPERDHWRTGRPAGPGSGPAPGAVNAVTGKVSPGPGYAASTVAHCETVCRSFYDYHLEAGSGPLANPFPLARKNGRAHAHQNPLEPFRKERAGLFRPRQPKRIPRSIPDRLFDELFASLPSNRDRALVAFWVSTGARAAELLGVTGGSMDPGSQLVTVIRKGSRAVQPLPASPDAFVWLRLYQEEMHGRVPSGPDDPVWWTLRRPFRPLGYHAARAMFTRAGASLGANWSLHDIRHSAAYRMARDPQMPITDVQWVLGHVHLSTTQIYATPTTEDVIASVAGHHRRQAGRPAPPEPPAAPGYRPESLDVLFGTRG
jgi:site-specific recombinase XerD